MEKRIVRRLRMKDEAIEPTPATATRNSVATRRSKQPLPVIDEKPKGRTRAKVAVEPTVLESSIPKTKQFSVNLLDISTKLKEPSITLKKLPSTPIAASKIIEKKSATIAPTVRATRASVTKTPTKFNERTIEVDVRNSPSRQSTVSSVSTVRTVDIAAATEGGDVVQEADEGLSEFIRRSASRTLQSAANAVRRSVSRPHSATPSMGGTESRYSRSVSHSMYDDEDEEYSDVDRSIYDENEQDAKFLSTNNDFLDSTQSFLCRNTTGPREFGGAWGISALLLSMPILITYLELATSNIKLQLPQNQEDYLQLIKHIFPIEVVKIYLSYQISIFVLSGILFGRKVRLPRENNSIIWIFNALTIAICANLGLGALAHYAKINVVDYVLQQQWRFCIYSLLQAFIFALWAYVQPIYNKKAIVQPNSYGKTGNFIIDYALGRDINPQWFHVVNLKQSAYRTQLITTLILAECYLIKNTVLPDLTDFTVDLWPVWELLTVASATVWAARMLMLYVLDNILFEHHLASSFELQGEGFGCLLLLRYAATPYLLSSLVRYSHEQQLTAETQLTFYAALFLLLIGLSIKRLSSAIKYKYRLNPTMSYFNNVESIHTYQGRRLLLGGYWGRLRQPNYSGDILALAAFCLPFLYNAEWQAHLGILLIIIMLLHRTQRVNTHNQQRYYSSWMRYCQQVRYFILPKIY